MWRHQDRDHSPKRNARADLDRVADQLGSGVILVKSHAKARRQIGNVDLPRRHHSGGILLMPWTAWMLAEKRIWDVDYNGAYALAGVMLAGLLLTWWARLHLGRLWSSAISRKQDHSVVDTGPYAFVRHPIYTGLITALLATAAAEATVTALLGAALIVFGLWLKARSEEVFLPPSSVRTPAGRTAAVSRC